MNKRLLISILSILVLIVLLFMVPVLIESAYWIHVLILTAINVLLACSLRTIMRIGQLSLGHAGFFLIGAYGSALLVMKGGLSFWLALPAGGLMAAVMALAVGYPFFRLKGMYFAILTLLLAEVLRSFGFYWTNLTGGPYGLLRIPGPNPITIPGIATITFDTKIAYYYLVLVILLLSLLILYRLERSRLGFVWEATNEADNLAQSVGINIMRHKIIAFAIGCFFAGIAGALFAHYQHNLICDASGKFSMVTSIFVLIYVVIGGEAKFAGPILGAVILTLIPEFAREVKQYQPAVLGVLLILFVFFLPEGLIDLPRRFSVWYGKVRGRPKEAGLNKG